MDTTKIILIAGAIVIVVILLWTGSKFLDMFSGSTEKECTKIDFQSSTNPLKTSKGKVIKDYTCPQNYHQVFADFSDVPKFHLCCVED